MSEIKVNTEFKNIEELKKLLQSAISQIEQLEDTLDKISKFKIQSEVKVIQAKNGESTDWQA